jgi:hypothetical protein
MLRIRPISKKSLRPWAGISDQRTQAAFPVLVREAVNQRSFRVADDTDNPRSCQVETVTAPSTVII